MLEGLHSAATGLMAQQQRLDAISNDIANVSTPGYKSLRVGFRDLVYQQAGQGAGAGVNTGSGAAVTVIGRSLQGGALRETGQPLDVAISGDGFIQVRRPDGSLALTRDGSLQLAADGRLRTSTGDLLDPPVQLPGTPGEEVEIGSDGTVSVGGAEAGRITLVRVPAASGLLAAGGNLFVPTAASGAPVPAAGAELQQGFLEGSNVDLAEAMVNMMDAQRGFQLASRAIQVQDDAWGIANGVKR
ncbi:MAG: flagellar hook-basal body protein [Thermoleophilaceae bacterium]